MTSLVLDEVKQVTGTYQKRRFDEEAQKVLSWLFPLKFYGNTQKFFAHDILLADHGFWSTINLLLEGMPLSVRLEAYSALEIVRKGTVSISE